MTEYWSRFTEGAIMEVSLKKLSEQVMVITGATSGIGLTTARMAADGGARLVLAARNAEALKQLAEELGARGAQALAVPTDVGVRDDVAKLGQAAVDHFGRIDTWVNNAGVSIFDTMLTVHAKNHMRHEPRLPPPLYAPEVVASAIQHAARHPQRDVYVGGAAKACAAPIR
jgi:short-subunit dehydrogenase involved in D-alanine esterification of teichoic acids